MNSENWILWTVARGFALVSIILGVVFFAGFSEALPDQIISGSIAVLLGVCQFAFVTEGEKHWRADRKPLAVVLGCVVICLFLVSVSGTAGFFESRFETGQAKTHKNSDAYQMQKNTVNEYKALAALHREKSEQFNLDGSPLNSAKQLRKATRAIEAAQDATRVLLAMPQKSGSSAAALNKVLDGGRMGMWFMWAVLLDVCAVLCFYCVGVSAGSKKVKTETLKTHRAETPKTHRAETVGAVSADRLSKIKEVKARISSGEFSETPGVRQVMRETGIKSNPLIKTAFNELEAANIVSQCPDTKTYSLVKTA
jgi:hypothetical protein